MYRFRQGTWHTPVLQSVDIVALTMSLSMQALVRAYDYLDGSVGQRLSVVERAFPLWVWSLGIFVGAAALIVGVVQRRHLFVWASHAWLFVWYMGLFVGYLLAALGRVNLDGLWFAGVMLTPLTLHLIFLLRNGPNPLNHDESLAVEVVRRARR